MSDLCPCAPECALQNALSSIGGKWKLPIICALMADGPTHFNGLLRKIRGISNTMLSQTLKELEADKLVKRNVTAGTPIRVEYELTEKAEKLHPILEQLIVWSME